MNKLTTFLIDEQQAHRKGGLYHKTQVQLAYNSNRIEGSKLTEEQTRYIFETRTIGFKDQEAVPVDDIIETTNHFVAFDYLLGKGFIHVHHIVPIHTIGKGYKVDPSTDLVPVCPNCHAMLHRGMNGDARSIDELKQLINSAPK